MIVFASLSRQGGAALRGSWRPRVPFSVASEFAEPRRRSLHRRCDLARYVGPHAVTQLRHYRGEAAESEPRLSLNEERLLKVAKPRSDEILRRHFALPDPTKIPPASFSKAAGSSSSSDESTVDWDGIRRKRLIYRSKQRGWLEVDLLLGTWASENVPRLSATELDEFEAFVNLETIDIYNVITLRIDIPQEIRSGVVERIQQWARESPLGKADPAMYEQVKKGNNLI